MHQKQMPAADDRYDSLAVEYKTDYRAAQTDNAFVETVSVDTAGKVGQAYNSQADYLVYYISGDGLIDVIALEVLPQKLSHWVRAQPHRAAQNPGHATDGELIPLDEFERFVEGVINV